MTFVIRCGLACMLVAIMVTDFQVRNFFNEYASRMNNALFGDPIHLDGIIQSFAEHFVGASPNGILAGQNGDHFKSAIQAGIAFYRNVGIRSMVIAGLEATVLDALHALVKIEWKCIYERQSREGEINFVNYYLVQVRSDDSIKIFAYVTGDEMKAFKEHGLL